MFTPQEIKIILERSSEAFRRGYDAYQDGLYCYDNPYHALHECDAFSEWRQGWWLAEDEDLDEKETCDHCGRDIDVCWCEYCNDCDEVIDDCICERCDDCDELIDDCKCERCDDCGDFPEFCDCDDGPRIDGRPHPDSVPVAYLEGFDAYYTGVPYWDNPYHPLTDAFSDWQNGWYREPMRPAPGDIPDLLTPETHKSLAR